MPRSFDQVPHEVHQPQVNDFDKFGFPTYNLCYNYASLASWPLITSSHEPDRYQMYFLVFKPFDSNKDTRIQKRNAMDHVRKKIESVLKYDILSQDYDLIITREINARRTHFNALVFCKTDLEMELHENKTSRYMIYAQNIKYEDKYKVHDYMVKESRSRYFFSKCPGKILDIFCARKYNDKYTRYYNNLGVPNVYTTYQLLEGDKADYLKKSGQLVT